MSLFLLPGNSFSFTTSSSATTRNAAKPARQNEPQAALCVLKPEPPARNAARKPPSLSSRRRDAPSYAGSVFSKNARRRPAEARSILRPEQPTAKIISHVAALGTQSSRMRDRAEGSFFRYQFSGSTRSDLQRFYRAGASFFAAAFFFDELFAAVAVRSAANSAWLDSDLRFLSSWVTSNASS